MMILRTESLLELPQSVVHRSVEVVAVAGVAAAGAEGEVSPL